MDDFDKDDFKLEDFTESDECKEKLKEEWKEDLFGFDRFKSKMAQDGFQQPESDIIIID